MLRQSTRAVTRLYDEALRPVELRITQYTVLEYIGALGEARVRDLGKALGLEETTLTRSLATLETRGWVQSRPGEDRRERLVSLTTSGKHLLAKARPLWESAQERMREHLPKAAWDQLFRGLARVAEAAA